MKSLEDLKKIKETAQIQTSLREDKGQTKITVAMSTCGITAGAREVLNGFLDEVNVRNLIDVHVTQCGCPGLCYLEPLVTLSKPGRPDFIYGKVTPERVKKIVAQHVVNDQPVAEWLVNLE